MALQNLRSSTPSKRPDASSMSDGQIALNTAAASAGLFFKDSNGDLVKTGPVHIGTTAPNSTPATGGSTGNSKGEAWLDTSNGNYVLKIYDGAAWQSVEIAPGSARQLLQTNAAGTDVEFTSNVDVPGTLDVTGATTLDSTASVAGLLSANGKISFAAGNAAAPGIYPGSDTDTGISSPSLNELSISTAGTSRLYIDSSGDVGIGVSDPSSKLEISGNALSTTFQGETISAGSTERLRIGYRTGGPESALTCGQIIEDTNSLHIAGRDTANGDIIFHSGSGVPEVMRIDAVSGNVGIGSSNPSEKLVLANVAAPTGFSDTAISMIRSNYGGRIAGYLDQGVGHGITFDTIDNANPTERLRITNNGNIVCGSTSTTISNLYTLHAVGTRGAVIKSTGGGNNPTQTLWNANSTGDSTLLEFRVNTTDTTVGNIVHDRSAGLVDYNTTSDYRAKTLNGRVENSGSIIDQLKVYNGTMHGATIELPMLVAHEAQEVVPYCVTGTKDAVDSEGNPIYQGMDVSKLVPLLIAEIQELRKRLSDAGI